jgi:predicted enzyme related to lactoylglutathione lyase
MSTGVQTAVGKFVWHDHGSPGPATATKFYADLFGWEYETFKPGEIDYEMVKANGQLHGGFGSPPGNPPAQWMGHVLVKDVDETVLRAEGAGGKILAEPMDMPEVGRMAVIADPQGAVIAAFSPQGDAPQNGGTFVWDELLTTDVDDAKRFYGEVFGWTSEDKPMGPATYTIFKRAGDTDVGGLMQRPREDIPVHWTTYIATQDADATVARAKELGATILSEPMDVPKMGRFAIIQDPTGAVFGIWQSAS